MADGTILLWGRNDLSRPLRSFEGHARCEGMGWYGQEMLLEGVGGGEVLGYWPGKGVSHFRRKHVSELTIRVGLLCSSGFLNAMAPVMQSASVRRLLLCVPTTTPCLTPCLPL